MDLFKENSHNDLYKNVFSKLLCIVNKSSYEKEQLKLHQSFLGVKGGGGKNSRLDSPLSNI